MSRAKALAQDLVLIFYIITLFIIQWLFGYFLGQAILTLLGITE